MFHPFITIGTIDSAGLPVVPLQNVSVHGAVLWHHITQKYVISLTESSRLCSYVSMLADHAADEQIARHSVRHDRNRH